MDAKAFNEWLQNRQLKQQGEEYLDAVGRMAETVNREFLSCAGPAQNALKFRGQAGSLRRTPCPDSRDRAASSFATTLVDKR